MATNRETGVGIVAPTPGEHESESGHIATYMIIYIIHHFHSNIHIFTRATAVMEHPYDSVTIHKISKPFATAAWYLRLPGQVIYQLKYCLLIWRQRRNIDMLIFGGSGFLFPMLFAKLADLYIVYRIGGVIQYQEKQDGSWTATMWVTLLDIVQKILYKAADVIVVISPYVATFAGMDSVREKIYSWCHFYFDFDFFNCTQSYKTRHEVVGQVGLMTEVKGSIQLLNGIKQLNESRDSPVKLLLVGDGPLYKEMKAAGSGMAIEFTGRIPRDRIPKEMNRMKLLVISSVTEGGPKVAWEAMACGTPVLATKVGMIPDYIVDGDNGFLLDSNDPSEIAERIDEILARDDLNEISKRARETAIENFSYQNAVEEYHSLLSEKTPTDPPAIESIDIEDTDPYFER